MVRLAILPVFLVAVWMIFQHAHAVEPLAEEKIIVDNAWARASITPHVKVGAVYVTVHNRLEHPIRLSKAQTVGAQATELHSHSSGDGVMRMRKLDTITINAGTQHVLAPGGDHLMLIGLDAPLVEGEMFDMVLTFCLDNVPENHCLERKIEVTVRSTDAT